MNSSEIPKGQEYSAGLLGYSFKRAKIVHCLMCKQPIGADAYVEDTSFWRFGQVFVIHLRCFMDLEEHEQRQCVKLRNKHLERARNEYNEIACWFEIAEKQIRECPRDMKDEKIPALEHLNKALAKVGDPPVKQLSVRGQMLSALHAARRASIPWGEK